MSSLQVNVSVVILEFYWWDTSTDLLFQETGYRFTTLTVEKVPHSSPHKTLIKVILKGMPHPLRPTGKPLGEYTYWKYSSNSCFLILF